jgi:hypothetical protein
MTIPRFFLIAAPLTCLALMCGCQATPPSKGYNGPTLPMTDVVTAINANNQQISTLWARHYYEATIVDDKKQSHFINGDGALLYKRPLGMLLIGTKPAVGRVFEVGSTDDVYWLKINQPGELERMWWGKYEHLGKPCVAKVPISPNMILEVLGVGTFNTDFTALPAPVMRFNNYSDAYMFVWVAPAGSPTRYAAVKEVWYDRKTFLPTRIMLFDADGRVQLQALLAKHQPIELDDVPKEKCPKIATNYQLFFPESGTKMTFDLSEMVPCKNGVPCRKGIAFPGSTAAEAGVGEVIQLDQKCEGK